jgi:DDE domain
MRYKPSLRDLAEMFLTRGFIFSYEAVREWEAKLTPALTEHLRRKRKSRVGRSWYVDETYIRVRGQWRYLYRAIDRDGVDRPGQSPASRRHGSPQTAMMPPRAVRLELGRRCDIERVATSTTDLSRTIAASKGDVDRCWA